VSTNQMSTNTTRQAAVFVNFSAAGTQEVASTACVIFQSSNTNVVRVSSTGLLTATGSNGTATITARFAGFTDTQVVGVSADSTPPTLVSARANGSRQIEVVFSEPVDINTGAELLNYTVNGPSGPISVNSAIQLADPARILLTLSSPMTCEIFTVTADSVADQSPLHNVIAPNSRISLTHLLQPGLTHRYTFNGAISN